MESKQLMNRICKILDDKNATDITVLDISSSSNIADYFIICSARSQTLVKMLFELLEKGMEDLEVRYLRKDGISEGKWVAIDYGTVIVHIFLDEIRQFYQLEKLWSNGNNMTKYMGE